MQQLFITLQTWLQTRSDDERGATAVEYGLMVGLIAAVIVVTVALLGGQLNNMFEAISDALPGGD
jgi:pilus assembly protein Flp/PilA